MNASTRKLEFIELDAMDAPDNTNDFVRGFAVGVILGILALT